jgi:predicted lipoprotein with Yx(FWY)xxD motif
MTTRTTLSVPIDRPHLLIALVFAAVLALVAIAVSPAASLAQERDAVTVGTVQDDLGTHLVGPDGMTLYYFTRDVVSGRSRCGGQCAAAWPPLPVETGQDLVAGEGVTGTLGVVPRSDGTDMATYRGRPLYHFGGDAAAGETNGQGVGGTWFVALDDGSAPPDPPALTLQVTSGELGTFLTDDDGLTLYFFARDTTPGRSRCTGDCLETWSPVTIRALNSAAAGEGVTGVVGLIPADGRAQVTYDGRPLYYFSADEAAGDTDGHGVDDVWFVADVDGTLPTE